MDLDIETPPGAMPLPLFNSIMQVIIEKQSDKWTIHEPHTPAWEISKNARQIPRMCGLYINAAEVTTVGVQWHGGPPARWDVAEDTLTPDQKRALQRQRDLVHHFEWFKDNIPFLGEMVPWLERQPHHLLTMGAFLHCHARQARNSDLKSLKDDVPSYVEDVTLDGNRSITVPTTGMKRTAKDHRGFFASWSGRQLAPRAGRDEFDDAPDLYCESVRDNLITIDHRDFPNFLYQDGDYDADRIDYGLCRGELLVKAYRHVFTSPSSADRPQGQMSTHCIASIYKLDRVTPESIAYVACLLRNSLSSCPGWQVDDGAFLGVPFYKSIVNLFADDTEWGYETLCWWNTWVYGRNITAVQATGRRPAPRPQDEILAEQRAARRRTTAATPAEPPLDSASLSA